MKLNQLAREKIRLALIGNKNGMGNRGKKRTKEQIEKMRLRSSRQIRTPEFRRKLAIYWTGRKRPEFSGENHWNWKGGVNNRKTLANRERIARRPRPTNCELCGKLGKIVFDHDHITGKFRGWLCQNCNITLGFVKDDVSYLQNLIKYLLNNGTVN